MIIEIKDLTVSYPDGTVAVSNFNLDVKTNQTLGIIGSNGAGKSTLLLSLLGIVPISSGSIMINGLSVGKKNYPAIRKDVGLVFQNPDNQLFMPRVYDDIAFAPRNYGASEIEVEKRIDKILNDLNAKHLKDKMTTKISGGEKRIASLATVLSNNPSVLLLDEPTSFLDPKSRRNTINLLSKLKMTKIIATHDLDMALDICDEIVIIKSGKVFAKGEAKEILTDKRMLEDAGLELPLRYQGE